MTENAPLTTINDLFRRVAAAANPRAVLWQDEFGQWQPISSDQIYQRARALAKAFLGWGVQKGDRIALIAENRWEWPVTDFAALAIGAVDVPIYPTLTGEQVAALVADEEMRPPVALLGYVPGEPQQAAFWPFAVFSPLLLVWAKDGYAGL